MDAERSIFDRLVAAYVSEKINDPILMNRAEEIIGETRDITLFDRLPTNIQETFLARYRGLKDSEIDGFSILFGGTVEILDMEAYRESRRKVDEIHRIAVRMIRDLADSR